MFETIKCISDEDWKSHRVIGGSSAACIVGHNPYKTAQELWAEIIGQKEPEDISDKPYVIFGKKAEEHIRNIFSLKYVDEYEVINPTTVEKEGYIEVFRRTDKPFMTATCDGFLVDKETGETGILEIKTCDILSSHQKEKWKDGIPMNYYCQILHYMAVRQDCTFAIVYAYLSYKAPNGETWQVLRPYCFSKKDPQVKADVEWLEEEETNWWNKYVVTRIEPPVTVNI